MIPSTTGSAAVPVTTGNLLFHVIVDDFNRTFSMDGPGGPNGIRLHYEMMRVARTQAKILRDFDVRAESREAALAEMKAQFPGFPITFFWVLGPPPTQNEIFQIGHYRHTSSACRVVGPSDSRQLQEKTARCGRPGDEARARECRR